MSFVNVAIGGSALIGAGASLIGSKNAAKAQTAAAAQSTALEEKQLAQAQGQYEQNRADLAPYRDAGYTALGQIGTGTAAGGEFNRSFNMADYQADPGYAFRLEQGNRGVEASAAARGGVLSGATLKALARYNQDAASQEYGAAYNRWSTSTTDRFNRLASVAGVGQTATNTGIAAGQANTAAQAAGTSAISSNLADAANARSTQYSTNAKAIGGLANSVGTYFALRNVGQPSFYGVVGSDGIY